MDSVRAKLGRADEHLRTLEAALTGLDDRTQHRIVLSRRSGAEANVVDLTEHSPIDSTRVPILVGEVLQHLRSALDHCIGVLERRNGVFRNSEFEFPIFWDAGRFKKESPRRIKGVSRPVADVIGQHQPFHWKAPKYKDHPLWIIHDLNNADKHRVLINTGATLRVDNLDLSLAPGNSRQVIVVIPQAERLAAPPAPSPEQVEAASERWVLSATFSHFGQTLQHPIIPGLLHLKHYVEALIAECEQAS